MRPRGGPGRGARYNWGMCGRFVSVSSPRLLADRFGVAEQVLPERAPDYNVTPRARVLVVRERPPRPGGPGTASVVRVLNLVRWGLVPSWAQSPAIGDKLINARAESIAEKPSFRRAFEKRRCIVPADAFYEWKRGPGHEARGPGHEPVARAPKQPYVIRRRDGEPLAFAGLWEIWRDESVPDPDAPDAWVRSCTIVTTRANEVLRPIHDRMPVVLGEDAWDAWLDPTNHDAASLQALLAPAPDGWFEVYPVSARVNTPRNNDADLLTPLPS